MGDEAAGACDLLAFLQVNHLTTILFAKHIGSMSVCVSVCLCGRFLSFVLCLSIYLKLICPCRSVYAWESFALGLFGVRLLGHLVKMLQVLTARICICFWTADICKRAWRCCRYCLLCLCLCFSWDARANIYVNRNGRCVWRHVRTYAFTHINMCTCMYEE